jgi:hypothetical protein
MGSESVFPFHALSRNARVIFSVHQGSTHQLAPSYFLSQQEVLSQQLENIESMNRLEMRDCFLSNA